MTSDSAVVNAPEDMEDEDFGGADTNCNFTGLEQNQIELHGKMENLMTILENFSLVAGAQAANPKKCPKMTGLDLADANPSSQSLS